MALNPQNLKDDILADSIITSNIPDVATERFEIYTNQTSIAITNQIERGLESPRSGIILVSPDLTQWRITIGNDGILVQTEL